MWSWPNQVFVKYSFAKRNHFHLNCNRLIQNAERMWDQRPIETGFILQFYSFEYSIIKSEGTQVKLNDVPSLS